MNENYPEPTPPHDPPADSAETIAHNKAADEANEPAPVDPKVEADSNWKPEGWVEGEQHPGYTPEPMDPDDPQHPDNLGDDSAVDEAGDVPATEIDD